MWPCNYVQLLAAAAIATSCSGMDWVVQAGLTCVYHEDGDAYRYLL